MGNHPDGMPLGTSRLLTAPAQVESLWRLAHHWLVPLVRRLWHVQITDRERMPAGPVIVVANHMSYFDPIFLGLAMPRPAAFLTAAPVLRWPLLGWLATLAGAMPVPPPSGNVLTMARRVLDADRPVILYPEGIRSPQGVWGSVPLHHGAARLAWQSGAPIQPVAMIGLERVLPVGATWPRFGLPVTIRFGAPLDTPSLVKPLDADQAVIRLTMAIDQAIADLLPSHLKYAPLRQAA